MKWICLFQCHGRLKLTDLHIVFKNSKTGKVDQLSVSDVELANWLKLVGEWGIRLFLKNGLLYRFIGFKDAVRDLINMPYIFYTYIIYDWFLVLNII